MMGIDSFSKQVTIVLPECPAIIEAAAIVEAEWMRLSTPATPVRRVTCSTLVTTMPPPRTCVTPGDELRVRWPAGRVRARQRSPPAWAGAQITERVSLKGGDIRTGTSCRPRTLRRRVRA